MTERLRIRASHLTRAQTSRAIGVHYQSVLDRIEAKKLPTIEEHGDTMIPRAAVLAWKRERDARERAS